jgi:peptidoglycan/LPS O-acetylase OafA/YrhL
MAATGASATRIKNSPDLRADQLLAGCALAVLLLGVRSYRAERWDKWWTVLVALSIADLARMVVFPFAYGITFFRNASTEVVAVESAIIIGYLVVRNRTLLTRTLSRPSLVWLGRRSYAVYLWHLPLFGLLSLKGQPTPYRVAGRAAAVVLTFVAAWASFKWVESPLYKRRVEGASPAEEGAPAPDDDLAVQGGHPLEPAPTDQDATKVSEP